MEAQPPRHTNYPEVDFNRVRPHEALGQTPPSAHYTASDRTYPKRLPILDYAPALLLRRVNSDGYISHHGDKISLSSTLAGEYVSLDEQPGDRWQIRYGPLQLGHWVAIDDTFEADVQWLSDLT